MLGAFVLLTAALAAINVPLSAYDIDQESTFRPNGTLPPLPFSSLIPDILQHPAGDFSPQILTVGDIIQLNNSVFNFTMTAAFNELDNTQPVSSFSYYNNPFSDGCDVVRIGAMMTCDIPTLFTLEYSMRIEDLLAPINPARENFNELAADLTWLGLSGLRVATEHHLLFFLSPSSRVAIALPDPRFVVTGGNIIWNSSSGRLNGGIVGANNTGIFGSPSLRSEVPDNIFQSLYHIVRMELGVILENQTYASPEMYNQSISGVFALSLSGANSSRLATTNATLMAEWRDSGRLFNETDRVPVMPYLRSVPRLKPLGSAITSVFVSTFAMLSVAWTIFSVIAGVLAMSHTGINEDVNEARLKPQEQDLEGQQRPVEEWDGSEACLAVAEDKRVPLEALMQRLSTVENKSVQAVSEMQLPFAEMQLSLAEMQRSLVRMRRSLRKHGIPEEIDDDTQIEG
ncbi:hypothetical protein B0H17DRAFT_1258368 [Mycena rosella]|uniref:Uncharacterized protein n=1 Tax=Mycena rosella TaxID=1033263 RepID=A0AAD7CT63_MYCRO|nr:hypothetical protein B0H17DRAFT_1258368 [Mycena rosella]